ncbi:MAG: bifunctional folylpolyglutamate synthase/dihydrofolate synthase [Lachnospiraceae bacterium]|nr:bifunctional folylpolyglutamate synthase/dihydrofolate synthase [Lachnospiraceae bacterium]
MASYQEACNYIDEIPKFAPKTGLDNTRAFLASLGNPEKQYKVVHIAGTNGKGSVAKMTALMLESAGYHVGLFISPHLVKMNERISVNGEDISDDDFAGEYELVLEKTKLLQEEGFAHPAYFEFLFCMAADYFAKQNCDYVVFETGLGGRLDATNTTTPVISIITSIGFDHMQYLGNTIEEIAGEKAGIIKPGVPAVYNTGNETADEVIRRKAKETGSEAIFVPEAFEELSKNVKDAVDYFSSMQAATYQLDNAMTAAVAFIRLANNPAPSRSDENNGDDTKPGNAAETAEKCIEEALSRFNWPGRMEFLTDDIVIDGAHNEDAAKRFAESLKVLLKSGKWKHLSLLFAVSSDKDYEEIIRVICENLDLKDVFVAELSTARKTASQTVGNLFQNYRPAGEYWDTYCFGDVRSAWNTAVGEREEGTLLAVVGSLYLVGEIKELCREEGI